MICCALDGLKYLSIRPELDPVAYVAEHVDDSAVLATRTHGQQTRPNSIPPKNLFGTEPGPDVLPISNSQSLVSNLIMRYLWLY